MPSVASFLFDENGTATDQIVEHYKHRAAGGPAAIIIEACSVSSNGFVSPHQGRTYHDKYIEGLSKIAAAIKAEGCLAGLQLHHSGRQTSPKVIKSMPVGPVAGMCTAWYAAERGYDVSLFEKEKVLGGQLRIGSIPEYKKDLQRLIEFYDSKLKGNGVKCYL